MSKSPAKGGHPWKHGGYALVNRETILREQPVIRRYLDDRRGQLVQERGGEEALSGGERILIDRAIALLSRTILIEYHYRNDAVLPPGIAAYYLTMNNSIRLSLVALGIDKKAGEKILDLGQYIAEKDKETAAAGQGAKDPGPIEDQGAPAPGAAQGAATGGGDGQCPKDAEIACPGGCRRDVPGKDDAAAPDPGQPSNETEGE